MEALTCPKCGAPLPGAVSNCPYCRVGLVNAPGGFQASSAPPAGAHAEAPASPTPPGWVLFKDVWLGFQIAHPPGWEVSTLFGQTSIKADPIGFTAAIISPFSSPTPTNAHQVAYQFTALLSQRVQNFQAWQQGNTAPDSNRLTIRVRGVRFGQPLEGIYNILVEGQNCIISGYHAPPNSLSEQGPAMAQILSTFRTTGDVLRRQQVYDPSEYAFSLEIPEGWSFRGGVNRNNIGGSASLQWTAARDAQGSVMVSLPSYAWVFSEPVMGMFAMPTGYPSQKFMLASTFAQQVVFGQYRQMRPDVQVVSILERPDFNELSQIELRHSGFFNEMMETSMASMEVVYTENGVRYRERSRVGVLRQQGMPMWNAIIDMMYRTPLDEMPVWEPVLTGCYNSMKRNPQWQANEQNRVQNYIQNSQADTRRRLAQISQTLSETSDIVANSYWSRQQTYDRISEMRSNATLGVQNVASDSGDVYKVPYGYDRYWVDGLGNLYGGSWLSQPDINWQPLQPTGI